MSSQDDTYGYQTFDGERVSKLPPRWDIFEIPTPPLKRRSDESPLVLIPLKFMKLLCYLGSFALVLGSSTVANLCLLLMTSQEATDRTMDLCVVETNRRYVVKTPIEERMGWTWAIWFTFAVPEIIVFFRCVWICIFKSHTKPYFGTFLSVFMTETLQTVGVSLLVLDVFPSLNVMQAIMLTNAFGFIPGVLMILSRTRATKRFCLGPKIILDIAAVSCIVLGVGVWTWAEKSWKIPLVSLIISVGWWENFVDEDSDNRFLKFLSSIRLELKTENCRYFVYLLVSLWKICLSFIVLVVYLQVQFGGVSDILKNFAASFESQKVMLIQKWQTSDSAIQGVRGDDQDSSGVLPIYVALIQVGSALVCYFSTLFACKVCVQEFGFSLPISLSVPLAVQMTSTFCSYRMVDNCYMTDTNDDFLPKYVFWTCPEGDFFRVFWVEKFGWVWLFWFFAQTWINAHIWVPHLLKRASTDRLFVNPMYNGTIISQSMIFNRRKHRRQKLIEIKDEVNKAKLSEEGLADAQMSQLYETLDSVRPKKAKTTIYGCATMWHETAEEMLEMLKSIMRLDIYLRDQRDISKVLWDLESSNYFDFELHIFFDDAFNESRKTMEVQTANGPKKITLNAEKVMVANDYVKKFVKVMGKAAAKMYPPNIRTIKPPTKVLTPYGGRLVWKLPGGTPITIHLKNKDLIRHKKRWSQVMYMYYLLGYLMLDPKNDAIKDELEDNTFVLALDGDIDFKPGAITKLLDLMDDGSLGAACGRIHPIGAGPIVWYQKFEYAIGHWLQKATEHVTGCVLCSPGCFSLFRAKALIEVMRIYASKAEEALHYVQYDQGEDRWLCTLILKRGYRIEYSAASDAYTHAPESFGEFYTQRRRWGPSTMANILDLLMDYKETVRVNNSISMPYIVYQGMIMLGTILGPGTIFLMVVGAIVAAFKIDNWSAFSSNIVPIILFIITCFYAKNEYQILFAMILSSCYALLMMAVLVGTAIQLTEDGFSSPSGIFLIALASSFIIAAFLHPQEFFCLAHGFLYFLCVPSMYLLLTIYSLINLNVVSWGTREDPIKKAEQEALKKQEKVKKKSALSGVSDWLGFSDRENFFQRMCTCHCCTTEKPTIQEEMKLLEESHRLVKDLNQRVVDIEMNTDAIVDTVCPNQVNRMQNEFEKVTDKKKGDQNNIITTSPSPTPSSASLSVVPSTSAEVPLDLEYWATETADLQHGPTVRLDREELKFWHNMIKKYLLPLDKDEDQEKRAANELIELRNKVVFAFIMINSLFILIVFLLQLNKDTLYINWPVNAQTNLTYIPETMRVQIDRVYLQLEPIGMVFAIFFGIILIYQFSAMIAHRFGTFVHIMAGTSLSWEFEHSQEFATGELLEEDSDDSRSGGGSLTNIPKMPLNPVSRHVSAYFLKKNSSTMPKFETLEEANQKQIRKRLKSLKRQDSAFLNRKGRKLSRTESMLKRLKTGGMISEDSEDEDKANDRRAPKRIQSETWMRPSGQQLRGRDRAISESVNV